MSHKFIETSDPRIDGTMTDTESQIAYPGGDIYPDGEFELRAGAWRIENDGGAWQQVPRFNFDLPLQQRDDAGDDIVFVGEDGYEGYIAFVERSGINDGFSLREVIIQDDLPAVPEPWSAE